MTYVLAIGDRSYSSWSLRGWLLFARFGLPVTVVERRLYSPERGAGARRLRRRAHRAGAARRGAGRLRRLGFASRSPRRWPSAIPSAASGRPTRPARGTGAGTRGGDAFRLHRPARRLPDEPAAVLRRLRAGRGRRAPTSRASRRSGRWPGRRTAAAAAGSSAATRVADAFFAPVAARVASYGLPVGPEAAAYVAAHLADPAFLDWRAAGLAEPYVQPHYDLDLPERPWPGPPR